MKWISISWALFMMALSVVPCSDLTNRCNDNPPANEVAQRSVHDHGEDGDDACTPLCSCACCGANIAVYKFDSPTFSISSIDFGTPKIIIRDLFVISSFFGEIWRPPQLSA